MKKIGLITLLIFSIIISANAADGMINISSQFSVSETAARFENILNNKGMTIFKRIKHSQSAEKIGIKLPDTELIIFGNPKVGSPLMQCQQTVAIDLPQKALIWKDSNDKVWISYNNPEYLIQRHKIKGCEQIIGKITKALAGMTKAAASQ